MADGFGWKQLASQFFDWVGCSNRNNRRKFTDWFDLLGAWRHSRLVNPSSGVVWSDHVFSTCFHVPVCLSSENKLPAQFGCHKCVAQGSKEMVGKAVLKLRTKLSIFIWFDWVHKWMVRLLSLLLCLCKRQLGWAKVHVVCLSWDFFIGVPYQTWWIFPRQNRNFEVFFVQEFFSTHFTALTCKRHRT